MFALLSVLHPNILLPWLLAMVFGIFVGGIPGLTATMAVALIVPISYYMDPVAGLAMIIGVAFSSIFAGDIPATYLRIPGTPASGAAILDGYSLTKKGKGSLALSIDLLCSSIGGFIGVFLLIVLSPPLANLALKFTNFEYFWLGVFGLSTSAILCKGNNVRGFMSAALGMTIATIGIDITTGYPRFTFHCTELMSGVNFIPAMIGLFGLSGVLSNLQDKQSLQASSLKGKINLPIIESLREIWKRKWSVIKSAVFGTIVGALPGAGADMAAWISYGMEKSTSKTPDEFGKGSLDGIVAPTSANNAALGGTWIPALVFGVPGDSITAIVLGAMLMYGLTPGPLIFEKNPELISSVFAVALVSQLFLIIIGFLGIKAYGNLLKMPKNILLVGVVLFSIIGSYALRNSFFDIYVMVIFGLIGFAFEKINVPIPPMILGIILGPMIEDNLRVGLVKTSGSFLPFLLRPFSIVLIILILFMLFGGKLFSSKTESKFNSV